MPWYKSTTMKRQKEDMNQENPMVWTFKITCEGGAYWEHEWIREFELPSDYSLNDLHDAIQEMTEFDNDHLFDFFAGRNARNPKIKFADVIDWEDRNDIFSRITLADIYPLPKRLALYYLFDFGDSWTFRILRKRNKPKEIEKHVHYPKIISEIGEQIEQYPSYDEDE